MRISCLQSQAGGPLPLVTRRFPLLSFGGLAEAAGTECFVKQVWAFMVWVLRFQHRAMVERHTKLCPTTHNVKAARGLHFPGHYGSVGARSRASSLFFLCSFASIFFSFFLSFFFARSFLCFQHCSFSLALLSQPLSPSSFLPTLFKPFAFYRSLPRAPPPPQSSGCPFTLAFWIGLPFTLQPPSFFVSSFSLALSL